MLLKFENEQTVATKATAIQKGGFAHTRMMQEIEPLYFTHNWRIDAILKGVVSLGELLFANRIRGYYLQGSHAIGDATSMSDVDMTILFKDDFLDEEERKRAWQVDTLSEWLAGRQLDIIPLTESRLSSDSVEDAILITHLKDGSRLLYGEDIRPQIQRPSRAVYAASCMYAAFRAISWHHHHPKPLPFPLNYPDPDHEFYGFNQSMHAVNEAERVGTERLVYSVVRIAGALHTLDTGQVLFSKRECVHAAQATGDATWGTWVAEVFDHCHGQWRYRIPEASDERRKLRGFYRQVLEYENYFLRRYYDLLSKDTDSNNRQLKQFADEQLPAIFHS